MLEGTSKPRQMEKQIENISGDSRCNGNPVVYPGRLVVKNIIRETGKKPIAVCLCACGNSKNTQLAHVKSGAVKSCGCLKKETSAETGRKNRKHGQAVPGQRGAAYRSWETMKARCYNEKDTCFHLYGGRGIAVCKSWRESFVAFLKDMGPRLRNTTIDRIDVNKNYTPSNCRWARPKVQQRNKRSNRIVVYKGEYMPLVALAEKTGVPYQRLHERIVRRGWDVEVAVNKVPQGHY